MHLLFLDGDEGRKSC